MKSANQLYKESGSELSFKEWLNTQQDQGRLEHQGEKHLNATGSTPTLMGAQIRTVLLVGLVGLGVYYLVKKA